MNITLQIEKIRLRFTAIALSMFVHSTNGVVVAGGRKNKDCHCRCRTVKTKLFLSEPLMAMSLSLA